MEEKIDEKRRGGVEVLLKTLSSSLGFFYIGYSSSLLNPLSVILGHMYNWGDNEQMYLSLANCLFFVGNFLGSVIAGRLI